MTEESPSSFKSFLENVGVKGSSKKIKFMPNVTNPSGKNKDETAPSSKAQKEHRRAQVRKAQIEHRQRKENYVKHLEEDVKKLREMIAAVEIETTVIKQENSDIRTALARSNISTSSLSPSANFQPPSIEPSPVSFQEQQAGISPPNNFNEYQSPHQDMQWQSSASSSSIVSVNFDDIIDNMCLHVSSESDHASAAILNSPDIFNFPMTLPQSQTEPPPNFSRPNPQHNRQISNQSGILSSSYNMPNQPDTSTIALNFILALEHPCRTHFHASTSEFDPKGDPSGHELMASTLLYSHAPAPIFEDMDSASWSVPSLELSKLWQMSQSLPKGDWEITPVQAWFLLTASFDVRRLLGDGGTKLNGLKSELSKLVGCFAFGAVMDEGKFWDAVSGVMGDNVL